MLEVKQHVDLVPTEDDEILCSNATMGYEESGEGER